MIVDIDIDNPGASKCVSSLICRFLDLKAFNLESVFNNLLLVVAADAKSNENEEILNKILEISGSVLQQQLTKTVKS